MTKQKDDFSLLIEKLELNKDIEVKTLFFKAELISTIIKKCDELNISERELARLSSINQSIVSRMLRGETNPRLDTIVKILEPLGLTLEVV